MAEALGFEPPALLVERTPSEEMLPLDEATMGARRAVWIDRTEEPSDRLRSRG